jgi:hypothetical protein
MKTNPIIICDDYATIVQGPFTIKFDIVDIPIITLHYWTVRLCDMARVYNKGLVSMAKILMNPPKEKLVDHINGNALDNRRTNLRIATCAQNLWNSGPRRGRLYKGSYKDKTKWKTIIQGQHIGTFETEIEAAKAYDMEAIIRFGEFAKLNFPQNSYTK